MEGRIHKFSSLSFRFHNIQYLADTSVTTTGGGYSDTHVVGVPFFTLVAETGVELDHLVITVQGYLQHYH